jgi:hypothetical protein
LLSLNTSKTNYLCFSKTAVLSPDINFKIKIHTYPCNRQSGDSLPGCSCMSLRRVSTIKYLGVQIDQNLRWDSQVSLVSSRIRRLIYIFKNLRQVADRKLLLQVYTALCESVICYCLNSWGGAARTYMIVAERAQRAVLKVLLKLPFMYATTELYAISNTLSVRKLYVLKCLCRFHKHIIPILPVTNKRRSLCTAPFVKSKFAQRHFDSMAPRIYNVLSGKIINLKKLTNYQFKATVKDFLSKLNYDDMENLLKINI